MSAAIDNFGADLRHGVVEAGDAAIREMQTNHPYQDRTYTLSGGMLCKPYGKQTRTMAQVIITFKAPYANIVNDGSVKAKAYPFVPQGLAAAEKELTRCIEHSLEVFCRGK